MKSCFYPFAIALGFTTLYCDSLLQFSAWVIAHWSGTPSSLFLAGTFDFLCIWILLAALLSCLHHHERIRNLVSAAMLTFTPSLLVEKRLLADTLSISLRRHRMVDLFCLALWLAVVTLFYKPFARYSEKIMLVFVFIAGGGVALLAHAAWLGWCARDLNPPFHDKDIHASAPSLTHRPRVIWIVMDELPYQFLFERRPRGLDLPAFDALARTGTVFTQATPPSGQTEDAMPAYLTAVRTTALSKNLDGTFSLLTSDTAPPIAFNQYDTIFQDARNAGYNTAVAGWYMPYCRVLPDVLDRCRWFFDDPLPNGMSAAVGLNGNIAAPFLFAAPHLLPSTLRERWHIPTNRYRRISYHIQEYFELREASQALIRDPSLGFVLLHLPVPHAPDIYDRTTGTVRFVPGNSFRDNLALADRCFAELRAELEETHQWDDTTVLLMGDHGWRGGMPQGIDDSVALRDPRQAYVVKLAGQKKSATISTPYNAIETRALLRALLQQTIRTPADLQRWAQNKQ